MRYPKIFLAIDNCFASKRYTDPSDWARVIRELGLTYVEASADNECDPLYMGAEYLAWWVGEVKKAAAQYGLVIANLYSGHGTYATLGLAHTHPVIRDRFLNNWLKPMAKNAGALGAGLGFFCHAFSDAVLQDPARYREAERTLYENLAELAAFGAREHLGVLGLEQMYTPHQIPWTIAGAEKLMREIYRIGGAPFYLTVDMGHMNGQRKFVRPTDDEMIALHDRLLAGDPLPELWLGPEKAVKLFESSKVLPLAELNGIMDEYPYLFAPAEDGNPYLWLSKLGGYSPIIHLQQADGKSSPHWAFTKEFNARGIVEPKKVLRAIKAHYDSVPGEGLPPRLANLYLTLEIFTGTADLNRAVLQRIRESVAYWREFIPEDGLTLDKLV